LVVHGGRLLSEHPHRPGLASLLCLFSLAGAFRLSPFTTAPNYGILAPLSRETDRLPPSNITWACFPPLHQASRDKRRLGKRERYALMAERALRDLGRWMQSAVAPVTRGRDDRETWVARPDLI